MNVREATHRVATRLRPGAVYRSAAMGLALAGVVVFVACVPRPAATSGIAPSSSTTSFPATSTGATSTLEASIIASTGDQATIEPTNATNSPTELPVPTGYAVSIEPGLDVNWTPAAAASTAVAGLLSNQRIVGRSLREPRVISVRAATGSDVSEEFSGPFVGHSVVWIVEAEGTFWAPGAPGTGLILGTNGYIVYDDQGNQIGAGFDRLPLG